MDGAQELNRAELTVVERLHQTREDIGGTNGRAGTNGTGDRVPTNYAWAIPSLSPSGGETKLDGYGDRTRKFGGNMVEKKASHKPDTLNQAKLARRSYQCQC